MSQLMHGIFFGTVQQQLFKSRKWIAELSNDGNQLFSKLRSYILYVYI